MVEFLKTLAIACIPAIITGIVTYIVARKNAASQISIIKEQNKHDLEKLMEQHKVDIEHLKEAHRLDMKAKEQDHKNKLELQQKEFENSLLKQQKDGENAMATETIKGVLAGNSSPVSQKRMQSIFMSRSSIPRSMAVESLPPEKETR